ncbi:MAG: hypothetical protein JSV49_12160 [Thermoplasmata archaeon]|nr:MAG: hypothetical protein JSV49_12160 [Thermoplasmata archaeon]
MEKYKSGKVKVDSKLNNISVRYSLLAARSSEIVFNQTWIGIGKSKYYNLNMTFGVGVAIAILNPMDLVINLMCDRELTLDDLFKLGQYLDAYEVERDVEDTLVIDIKRINKTGTIYIYITPQGMMTYDEICEHIKQLMEFALTNAGMDNFKWEVREIIYYTKRPGTPSYVQSDDSPMMK